MQNMTFSGAALRSECFGMDSHLATLRLFNEKAERLNGLRFTAAIRENRVNCRYTLGIDTVAIDRDLPDVEEIEAFVLTYRLFVQDSDGLSFRALDALYRDLPVPPELVAEVGGIRVQVNEYLDGPTPVVLREHRIARREVLDKFLYGAYAHVNREKASVLSEWRRNDVLFSFLEAEFVLLLGVTLQAIFWLRQCNVRALAHLSPAA